MERKRIYCATDYKDKIIGESNNTLIIQRVLGHKADIPGSGQWEVITDSKTQGECWVCSLSKYSLLFFSEITEQEMKHQYNIALEKLVITKLLEIQEK